MAKYIKLAPYVDNITSCRIAGDVSTITAEVEDDAIMCCIEVNGQEITIDYETMCKLIEDLSSYKFDIHEAER